LQSVAAAAAAVAAAVARAAVSRSHHGTLEIVVSSTMLEMGFCIQLSLLENVLFVLFCAYHGIAGKITESR